MLPCPFHLLTGLQCPFCGGQRMLLSLANGNFDEAWSYNPLLLIALPFLVAVAVFALVPRLRASRVGAVLTSSRCYAIIIIVFTLWGVLRNLI